MWSRMTSSAIRPHGLFVDEPEQSFSLGPGFFPIIEGQFEAVGIENGDVTSVDPSLGAPTITLRRAQARIVSVLH